MWDEFREEGEKWLQSMHALGITLQRMREKDAMLFNCSYQNQRMVEDDYIFKMRYIHDYEFSSWVMDNEADADLVRAREYESQEACLESLFTQMRAFEIYDEIRKDHVDYYYDREDPEFASMHVRRFYYHHPVNSQYIEVDAKCLTNVNLPMGDARYLVNIVWDAALKAGCYYRKILMNHDSLYNREIFVETHRQVDTEDRFYHENTDKTFLDMVQFQGREARCDRLVLSQEFSRKGGDGEQLRVVLM